MNYRVGRSPKVFFGWWTVLFTGIISGLGHGFYGFGMSVFFKDLAMELGLSRALTSVAAGIGRLEGGITSPLTGWLADRYGPRWVIFTGVLVAGIGMVLMNFITTIGAYIIAWGVLTGVGLNIGLTIAVDKTLNDWFVSKRGLAQGTKFALIGLGGVIVLPVVTWLVTWQGWRMTCLIWGVVLFAGSPLTLIFVKQKRPEYYGMLPDGAQRESDGRDMIKQGEDYASSFKEREHTFKQAVKTQAYWLLTTSFGIQSIIYGGLIVHMIPFLTDMGIERTIAGRMMGMMVFFTIPSRFLGGLIVDRIGKGRLSLLLAGAFFLQAAGIIALLIDRSMTSLYVFLILFGLSSGASTPLYILMIGRYFGRKAFGSILGSSLAIRAPLSLVAPVFTGWVYDTFGNYTPAFTLFAALSAIAALLACLARPAELPLKEGMT